MPSAARSSAAEQPARSSVFNFLHRKPPPAPPSPSSPSPSSSSSRGLGFSRGNRNAPAGSNVSSTPSAAVTQSSNRGSSSSHGGISAVGGGGRHSAGSVPDSNSSVNGSGGDVAAAARVLAAAAVEEPAGPAAAAAAGDTNGGGAKGAGDPMAVSTGATEGGAGGGEGEEGGVTWEGVEPPEEFVCPLSLEMMFDPVIVSSGQTYERAFIARWMSDGHNTCPKTRQPLQSSTMYPNQVLKAMIVDWCIQNHVPLPTPKPADPGPQPEGSGLPDPLWRNRPQAMSRAEAVAMESERRQRAALLRIQEERRQHRAGAAAATAAAAAAEPAVATAAAADSSAGDAEAADGERVAAVSSTSAAPAGAATPTGSAAPAGATAGTSTSSVSASQGRHTRTDSDRYGNGIPSQLLAGNGGGGGLGLAGWPGKLAMKAAIFRSQEWPLQKPTEEVGTSAAAAAGVAAAAGATPSASSSSAGSASTSGAGAPVSGPAPSANHIRVTSLGIPSGGIPSTGSISGASTPGRRTPAVSAARASKDMSRESARALARDLRSVSMERSRHSRDPSAGGESGRFSIASSSFDDAASDAGDAMSVGATSVEELRLLDVEQLVDNVRAGSAPEDQAASAALLRVMTRHGFKYSQRVVAAGGIEPLVALMTAADDEPTVEHAVTALLNLSLDDGPRAQIAAVPGVVEGMVTVLSEGMPQARANAAAALFSISKVPGVRELIAAANALPPLLSLLEEGGVRAQKDAAHALLSLCMSKEQRSAIARSGVVSLLCRLLRDDAVDAVEEQTAAIFAALVRDPDGRQALQAEGAIPTLAELVEGGGTMRCREYAVNALLGLAVNSRECLAAIDEEGISASIDVLTRTGSTKTQAKATALLELLRKFEAGEGAE